MDLRFDPKQSVVESDYTRQALVLSSRRSKPRADSIDFIAFV
jgi:hypothetical protein